MDGAQALGERSCLSNTVKVDTSFNAHTMQHLNQILRSDVSRSSRGVGTAAESTDGTIDNSYPGL